MDRTDETAAEMQSGYNQVSRRKVEVPRLLFGRLLRTFVFVFYYMLRPLRFFFAQ